MSKFSKKTFQYFDQVHADPNNLKWFEDNKSLYEDHVLEPFRYMINLMDLKFGEKLDKIEVSPSKITRPKNAKNRAEKGLIKDFTKVDIMEKRTSLFEWNPGFHISFGSKNAETYFAGGMYMVTGRQIKEYRKAVKKDYKNLAKILNDKKFKKSWGQIESEMYKRFPKGYDPDAPYAQYLWMKQFYFAKSPSRTQMIKKGFIEGMVDDFENALDVLNWIRNAVGTYQK